MSQRRLTHPALGSSGEVAGFPHSAQPIRLGEGERRVISGGRGVAAANHWVEPSRKLNSTVVVHAPVAGQLGGVLM